MSNELLEFSQWVAQEKIKQSQQVIEIINKKNHKEILKKLTSMSLAELMEITIAGQSIFSYCLKKVPDIVTKHQRYTVSSFTKLEFKELLPLHYVLHKAVMDKFLHSSTLDEIEIMFLLQADVNLLDEAGGNALHCYFKAVVELQNDFAISNNNSELKNDHEPKPHNRIVEILLDHGVDISAKDYDGKTPLDYTSPSLQEYIHRYLSSRVNSPSGKAQLKIWKMQTHALLYDVDHDDQYIHDHFPRHPQVLWPPAMPLKSKAITQDQKNAWIQSKPKDYQDIARQEASSIRYISFSEFLSKLKKSINSFNDCLNQQPKDRQKYILVVDERKNKSGPWVTALALKYLANIPHKILDFNEVKSYDPSKEGKVDHIVFIDDASYSGNQLTMFADWFLQLGVVNDNFLLLQMHIVIPYMSEKSIAKLASYNFIVHEHETIAPFCVSESRLSGATATYFQHKLAESGISTIVAISEMIGEIQPPYKLNPISLENEFKNKLIILKNKYETLANAKRNASGVETAHYDSSECGLTHSQRIGRIQHCFNQAQQQEKDFQPYERSYTFADAYIEVSVLISSEQLKYCATLFSENDSNSMNTGSKEKTISSQIIVSSNMK